MARKEVKITLKTEEIIYDVKNKTYITSESRKDGKTDEFIANIKVSDDDNVVDQIMRTISNSYADLKLHLADYISNDNNTTSDNMLMSRDEDIVITLSMPSNYNIAGLSSLSTLMHRYIVDKTLAEWLLMTDKEDATEYAQLSQIDLNNLRVSLYKRERPQKHTT